MQVVVNVFNGFGCWKVFLKYIPTVPRAQIKPSSLFYRPENDSGKRP